MVHNSCKHLLHVLFVSLNVTDDLMRLQIDDTEGQETWRKLEMVTSDLAQDLCESLRLILEPSQASRLKVRI